MALSIKDAEPIVAKAKAERRRFRRVRVDLPGGFSPRRRQGSPLHRLNLSPGGAAIDCDVIAGNRHAGGAVCGRLRPLRRHGGAARRPWLRRAFVCTPAKRERTAEQLTLFLNKALVDETVLRRHERTHQKGFAKFTRADGQIVNCEVMDISVGGVRSRAKCARRWASSC